MSAEKIYENVADWEILHKHLIIDQSKVDNDSPFRISCVPILIRGLASKLSAIEELYWIGVDSDANELVNGYMPRRRICFDLQLEDTITLFDLEIGRIADYSKISVEIYSLANSRVGGEFNSSTGARFDYTGFGKKMVPSGGLMVGEPGSLFEWEDALNCTLRLNPEEFDILFNQVVRGRSQVNEANVAILAELFEDDDQAALSERFGWCVYGLLDSNTQRARLESISLSKGELISEESSTQEECLQEDDQPERPHEFEIPPSELRGWMVDVNRKISIGLFLLLCSFVALMI